jgi:hypothetical protein
MAPPRRILVALAGIHCVGGFVMHFLPSQGAPLNDLAFVLTCATALMLFAWCKADAKHREALLPRGSSLLVALCPPVGVPVYYFRTRPWRQALGDTAKAVGYLVILMVVSGVGLYVGRLVAT